MEFRKDCIKLKEQNQGFIWKGGGWMTWERGGLKGILNWRMNRIQPSPAKSPSERDQDQGL